jgi:hypothetical protein
MTARGNERRAVFRDDRDRRHFLEGLVGGSGFRRWGEHRAEWDTRRWRRPSDWFDNRPSGTKHGDVALWAGCDTVSVVPGDAGWVGWVVAMSPREVSGP